MSRSRDIGEQSSEVRDNIHEFVCKLCFMESGDLDDADPLLSSQQMDSLGLMELVAHLEECYGIAIDATELTLENCDSVDMLCKFVSAKRP